MDERVCNIALRAASSASIMPIFTKRCTRTLELKLSLQRAMEMPPRSMSCPSGDQNIRANPRMTELHPPSMCLTVSEETNVPVNQNSSDPKRDPNSRKE